MPGGTQWGDVSWSPPGDGGVGLAPASDGSPGCHPCSHTPRLVMEWVSYPRPQEEAGARGDREVSAEAVTWGRGGGPPCAQAAPCVPVGHGICARVPLTTLCLESSDPGVPNPTGPQTSTCPCGR